MKGEIRGGGKGEMNEGYKSSWWGWGPTGAQLWWTTFWFLTDLLTYILGLRTNKSQRKSFLLTVFPSHSLPHRFLITIVYLDTLFSLPTGCRIFGPSCCCVYSQDWGMNPGAFSSSGPLSWAMYLMRKGRTGSGLFGKANSSLSPPHHHHPQAFSYLFSAFNSSISILIDVFDTVLWCRVTDPEPLGRIVQ